MEAIEAQANSIDGTHVLSYKALLRSTPCKPGNLSASCGNCLTTTLKSARMLSHICRAYIPKSIQKKTSTPRCEFRVSKRSARTGQGRFSVQTRSKLAGFLAEQ